MRREFQQQDDASQKTAADKIPGARFDNRSESACIKAFMNKRRKEMRDCPNKFPPRAGVPLADNMNGHILELLSGWFSKSFAATINTLTTSEPPPAYQVICATLKKKLTNLIAEGSYKAEGNNHSKAFPAACFAANGSLKRSAGEAGIESDDDDGAGTVMVTKKKLKRIKQKAKQKANKAAYAAQGGSGGNPNNVKLKPNNQYKGGGKGKGGGKNGGGKKGAGNYAPSPNRWCHICKNNTHWTDKCFHNPANAGAKGGGKGYQQQPQHYGQQAPAQPFVINRVRPHPYSNNNYNNNQRNSGYLAVQGAPGGGVPQNAPQDNQAYCFGPGDVPYDPAAWNMY
jgi:hypothetical protein